MFTTRLRRVLRQGGESCGINGCTVAQGDDLVVLELNGKPILDACGRCAGAMGDTLMADERYINLRRRQRALGQPTT